MAHGDPSVVLPPHRKGNRKYALDEGYFDDVSTPEKAYWLGFITADGGIIRNAKTNALRLELAEKDAEHVQRFADALGSDKPLRFNRGCIGISLDSWYLVESLERLGITQRKSATVEPWDGPDDLMPHYWRGLFDGDGCVCRSRGKWQLGICGSHACVEGFARWARDVCESRAKEIPTSPGSSCWQWSICGTAMPRRLAEALYLPGYIALKRKSDLVDMLCERR